MTTKEDKEKEKEDKELEARLLGNEGDTPEILPENEVRAMMMSRGQWLNTLSVARVNLRISKVMEDDRGRERSLVDGGKALQALDELDKEIVDSLYAMKNPYPSDIEQNLPKEVRKALKQRKVESKNKEA